jgi:chorismate--pyruvate lyase
LRHTQAHIHWYHYRHIPRFILGTPWREWVLEEGSLTRRLQLVSKGDFRVRLVKNRFEVPRPDERQLLQLPVRQSALIREVELLCLGQTWVTARSIIPQHTLTGAERQLAHLGERPLGGYLFSAKTMRRTPFEVGRKKVNPSPAPLDDQQNQREPESALWARRSLFFLHDKPLLVSEFFEPALFRAMRPNRGT